MIEHFNAKEEEHFAGIGNKGNYSTYKGSGPEPAYVPPPEPPSPPEPVPVADNGPNIDMILGLVAGGILLLAIVITVVIYFIERKFNKGVNNINHIPTSLKVTESNIGHG